MTIDFLERDEWGATVPLGPRMQLPAQGIHVHHSVTIADDDQNYHSTDDVAADMRELEWIGKQRFDRFSYCYCVHPSGIVAVGAGTTIGAHTAGFNSTSIGICFIGNYEQHRLTDRQKIAFCELRFELQRTHALRNGHYVEPHRARKATACPGKFVIEDWNDLLRDPVGAPLPRPQPRPVPPVSERFTDVQVRVLRTGLRGADVRSLQGLLNTKNNARLVTDGIFGPRTGEAVKFYQRRMTLTADGIVGPKTWTALVNR